MNWELLTSDEFVEARERADGVCIIPIGVLERHGSHLPLGTDALTVWEIANLASARTPVMVFPQYVFGQIPEATHEPGTVAISLDLMISLLDAVCYEICRNGFNKIVLLDGHGGNNFWRFFLARQLEYRREFMVYHYFCDGDATAERVIDEVSRAKGGWGEHAGGTETATSLALFPELVKLDKALSEADGVALTAHRDHFKGSTVSTPVDWYAGHPTHLDGYFGKIDTADGKRIVEAIVSDLVVALEKIKKDDLSSQYMDEFYGRSGK